MSGRRVATGSMTPATRVRIVIGLLASLAVVASAVSVGFSRERLFTNAVGNGADSEFGVGAAPFYGRFQLPDDTWKWALAVLLGVGVVLGVSALAKWSRFWAQTLCGGAIAMAWAFCLQWVRGGKLVGALQSQNDYRYALGQVKPGFFADYISALPSAPVHVKGHPPLSLGTVWLFHSIVPEAAFLALVILVGIGLTVVLVADTVRRRSGVRAARAVLPALVTLPAVIWAFPSFDGFMMFELALAAWCAALAVRRGVWGHVAASCCGLLCGVLIFSSYGAVVMVILPAAILWKHRSALLIAAVAGLSVVAFIWGLGFWWFDGLAATREYYVAGISAIRPYDYFTFLANPAIVIISMGPAAVYGWFRRRADLVAWAALLGVVLADLSGMSKGEVERIWVPMMPWLATASAGSDLRPRTKAALGVGMCLLLALVLDTPW